MRIYHPDQDAEDLARLNAEPWMIKQLSLNPSYPHWGPYEDYMCKKGDGWDSRVIHETWTSFGPWQLNDMNEIVNFYFDVCRESEPCDECDCSGYNAETRRISEDWYDLAGTGRRWHDNITQDEAQALYDHERLNVWSDVRGIWEKPIVCPSAESVNANQGRGLILGHDAINRHICIEARAKRLGVYGLCEACSGTGDVFTAPAAKLGLVLWVLHPRKGCSRGIHIKSIEHNELPDVHAYLLKAARRNAKRFGKIKRLKAVAQ